MVSNVKRELDLYPGMCKWLETYLSDKYRNKKCNIVVLDCHSLYLDSVLSQYHVIQYYPQIVGLKIEIDVLGIVIWETRAELYFIEAKKTALNLQNLGQLLIYCRLCNPECAYLLSSGGLGSLENVLVNLKREDLLNYGNERKIQQIKVAKWDITRNSIDYHSIVPKN